MEKKVKNKKWPPTKYLTYFSNVSTSTCPEDSTHIVLRTRKTYMDRLLFGLPKNSSCPPVCILSTLATSGLTFYRIVRWSTFTRPPPTRAVFLTIFFIRYINAFTKIPKNSCSTRRFISARRHNKNCFHCDLRYVIKPTTTTNFFLKIHLRRVHVDK